MTFTIIERYTYTVNRYTLDVETLDDLFALGHDRFGDAPMTIDWATLTITVTFGE